MEFSYEVCVEPSILLTVDMPIPATGISSADFSIAKTKCYLQAFYNTQEKAILLYLGVRHKPPTKFKITTFVVEEDGDLIDPRIQTVEDPGYQILWRKFNVDQKPKWSFRICVQEPDQVSSEKFVPDSASCLYSLVRDMRLMLEDISHHDVRLLCEGEVVTAHRAILSARSPVFKAMFHSNMEEDLTGVIVVPDVKLEVLRYFIRYLYTGKLPQLPFDLVVQLYEVADKYSVDALKEWCSQCLKFQMDINNACEILVLADIRNDQDLKKRVFQFIHQNSVQNTWRGWQRFLYSHSNLASEILTYGETINDVTFAITKEAITAILNNS